MNTAQQSSAASKVRNAILLAASHIESTPHDYDYDRNSKPVCRTPGCMLGWIGKFLRIARVDANDEHVSAYTDTVAKRLGHSGLSEFLGIAGSISQQEFGSLKNHQVEPKAAAKVLRVYADQFHPAPSPTKE
jgi:hypothetical protein